MEEQVESGVVKNQKETTYKFKDKDGKKHVAQKKLDKDTGELEHTIDGKKLEMPKQQVVKYQASNFEQMVILQLNNIYTLLKEMNYYLSYLDKKDG